VLLVALGEGVRLGVDLELLRPRPRVLEMAALLPPRGGGLAGAPGRGRARALVLPRVVRQGSDAEGARAGISFGLHRLQLAPGADGGCTWLVRARNWARPRRWHLHEWAPEPGWPGRTEAAASGDNDA
jgi:4'-phosphopantetheinyl transferase